MDYDASRNPQFIKFYNSAAWKRCRWTQLSKTPWCEAIPPGQSEPCGKLAQHVHHVQPIATPAGWEHRLDQTGLMSVCIACHNRVEADGPQLPFVAGMLDLCEDDQFYFDAAAGDRPIRFIEAFCTHTEGKMKGQPFILHPIQKKIIREVYGFKHRNTHLRRFSRIWWNAAVGTGKSPLCAALGTYELVAGDEQGNQIFSLASDYQQSKVVFDQAKAFIKNSKPLSDRCRITKYEITCCNDNVWKIVSGKTARAGDRPGIAIADECHQWKYSEAYNDISGRMAKRPQPLLWVLTNAAENVTGTYQQLHEEAIEVLTSKRTDPTLYPIIWAADPKAAIDDPAAWKAANPLIGTTIQEEQIRIHCHSVIGFPNEEAKFRRNYLGQHIKGTSKWIDPDRWRAVIAPIDPAKIKDAPLYVGLDMSRVDDLTAVIYVWATPTTFYVDSHFYIPAETARRYEQSKHKIPYLKWEAAGAITLLEESTISPEVQKRIVKSIQAKAEPFKLVSVNFDRAYVEESAIAHLKAAGITCNAIAQGWSITPGCQELDRRLKDKSIIIAPNPVLSWNADNAEIKSDDRGNYWPVKPKAKGRYAGTTSQKIDGITALATVMTEARKHDFPVSQKQWKGDVFFINTSD